MIKMFQGITRLENFHKWKLMIAFLLCVILGVFVEIMQNFIPGRNFELMDLAFNLLGTLLGLTIFEILNKVYG